MINIKINKDSIIIDINIDDIRENNEILKQITSSLTDLNVNFNVNKNVIYINDMEDEILNKITPIFTYVNHVNNIYLNRKYNFNNHH